MSEHCDSNPTHPPARYVFTTPAPDAVLTPLCQDCLVTRVAAAVDHGEHFQAGTIDAVFPRRWMLGLPS